MEDPVRAFPKTPGTDLKSAMRRARVEEAERSSAVAELRGAETARLEMLRDALEPVFAQLPKDADMFDLGLVPGEKPRLFVDMVAYVELDRDRRTFRLVQDTRAGRFVLAENDRIDPMTEAVTAYLGRRLVERERALAGELRVPEPIAARGEGMVSAPVSAAPGHAAPAADPIPAAAFAAAQSRSAYSTGDVVFVLLVGIIMGAALVFLAAWWKAKGGFAALGFPAG
jgi:hypothetical protein